MLEELEGRRFLSGSPVYAAHSTVAGATLETWSARYWQKLFATPIFKSDETTFVNPAFLDGKSAIAPPSDGGHVVYLAGTFGGGNIDRTVTLPQDTPIFAPIYTDEWSNPDTAAPPDFTKLPGKYTTKQLQGFATVQTNTVNKLSASLDGKSISGLFDHRETAAPFSYTLPKSQNLDQAFFGENISGKVSPAAADGYYLMLKPLSPGKHTIVYSANSPDDSSVPPLLGPTNFTMTYHINVVSKSQYLKSLKGTVFASNAASVKPNLFGGAPMIAANGMLG